MAKSSAWLSLSLSLLLLFHGSLSEKSFQFESSAGAECQLRKINANEPDQRIEAEGGYTEFWNPSNAVFRCGGAHVYRHIIYKKGLFLPSYTDAPLIVYVLQGTGYFGIVIPGCAETFQSFEQSEQGGDRHQKVGYFRKGDILTFPQGAAHWLYNNGNQEVVLLVLQDTSNDANQLDENEPLRFFLAGNAQEQQGEGRSPWKSQQHGGQKGQQQMQEQLQERLGFSGSLLNKMRINYLTDALNIDRETAQKIRGEDDHRGHIVTVEQDLELIIPPSLSRSEEEEQDSRRSSKSNGLEETVCTPRVRQNIDNPARVDIFDAQAGRFTTLNSFTLPILGVFKLSAARGVLNRNYGIGPKWCMNGHSFIYVTKGSARVQIINNRGEPVLDEEVQQGQLFLVPQNFIVVKQAGEQGFEWVEFNTVDNAMFNTLAGRTSTLAGLPADIIAASYQIPREKALELKRNMVSTWFYRASSSSSGRAYAFI